MRNRVLGTTMAVVLAGTAALAQKVTTDMDPVAPFSSYRTYAWTAGTPSPNPLGEQRIHAAVDAQLRARNFMLVDSAPDVYVATHLTTREEQEVVANGFGYGYWGFGGTSTVSVHTYVKGTLMVDLYDSRTKKMVWRGVATDTASSKPEKNARKVNEAVAKMFEKYPSI